MVEYSFLKTALFCVCRQSTGLLYLDWLQQVFCSYSLVCVWCPVCLSVWDERRGRDPSHSAVCVFPWSAAVRMCRDLLPRVPFIIVTASCWGNMGGTNHPSYTWPVSSATPRPVTRGRGTAGGLSGSLREFTTGQPIVYLTCIIAK